MSLDFDYISITDKNNPEYIFNFDMQTIFDNNSWSYVYVNKFDKNRLSITTSENLYIPNIIPSIPQPSSPKNAKKKNNSKIKEHLKKKRGRKSSSNKKKGRKNPHDRKCPCNIRTRSTIAYFTFLFQLINAIIEFILSEEDGIDISQYKLKKIIHCKNITLNLIKDLKKKTIKDIFSFEVNSKNIFGEKKENEEICNKIIQKSKILENILNQHYMEFFENIFCQKKREFNLTKYGINKSIFLNSDVILYKDFINNIKNKENSGDDLDQYLLLINEGIKNYLKI